MKWWKELDNKQKLSLTVVWLLASFFTWRSFLPFMAELNYRNAYYHDSGNNYEEAVKYFRKAVQYFPWETYYRVQLGGTYEKLADKQQQPDDKMHYLKLAEEQYNKCLEITDRNPWYHNRLGSVYLKYSQMTPDKAEQAVWRKKHEEKILIAADLDKNNGIFQLQAGYLHFQKGEYQQAEEILMHIINDIDEQMVDPYLIMADLYRATDRPDQAQEILEKIVEIDPTRERNKMERVYIQLGSIYDRAEKYELAVEMYINALKVNRNSSAAASLLKRAAYYARDKERLALAAKLLAVKFQPDRVENYLLYFQLANRDTEQQDIRRIMKIARDRFPDNQEIKQFERALLR